jgi:hypothetical protein
MLDRARTRPPERPPPPPRDRTRRDRHRRHRARQRDGKACYQVELGCDELTFLIRTRWLTESEVTDKACVSRALAAMLADAARR